MLSCCLKCRRNTESKNPIAAKTKSGKPMFLSEYAACDIKNHELSKNKKLLHYF